MAGVNVGVGYIDIRPDMSGFGRELQADMGRDLAAAGATSGRTLGTSVMSSFKGAMAIGGTTLGGVAIGSFLKGAVNASSELNEVTSKSNQVFQESAGAIRQWAEGGAENFGLSKRAALEAASGFGNMFVQLGIGLDQAAAMSTGIVELAADFASFHNADITQVLDAQAAAFRGEYDSLQRFLPLINAATVEQRALEMTGKRTTKELTAQEKALAVQALMLEGAGDAAGDFDRTSDSLANSMRTLSAESENTKATLGDALAPAMAKLVGFLNDSVIPAFMWLGEVIGEGIADAAGFFIGAIADMLSVTAKALEKIDQFVPGLEGVPEAMADAVDEMRSWEAGLHDMHSALGDTTDAADEQTVAVATLATEVKDLTILTVEAADAQRTLDQATRELGAANRERADAQDDLNELLARGAVDEQKIAAARKSLTEATRGAAAADRALANAQEAYDEALAESAVLHGFDTAMEKVEDAADNLADAQDASAAAHERAAEAAEELREAQAGDPEYQDKLADARDRVADATDRIAEAEKELTTRSEEAVAAHDAERVAIGLKADEVARLRAEHEKLLALGLGGVMGPFTSEQLGMNPVVPPGFVGPLSAHQTQAVAPEFIGPLSSKQTVAPAPQTNNFDMHFYERTDPQQVAKAISWQLLPGGP